MAARKIKLAHPGKILREEFIEPVGLSAYALAKALDVPLPRVNDIVREKRSISPEMAVLLSTYFGTTDGYWINLQAHYHLENAKGRIAKEAARQGIELTVPIQPLRNIHTHLFEPRALRPLVRHP